MASFVPRHKAFISFHHADECYRRALERMEGNIGKTFISRSVQIGDIDPNLNTDYVRRRIREENLHDSTVTVVLIGRETWKRKYVDWEIYSSLRESPYHWTSGLVGFLLPNYPRPINGWLYDPYTIPPRLWDNVDSGFARVYRWPTSAKELATRIHEAYLRRRNDWWLVENRRPMFRRNRPAEQTRWTC